MGKRTQRRAREMGRFKGSKGRVKGRRCKGKPVEARGIRADLRE